MSTPRIGWLVTNRPDLVVDLCLYPPGTVAKVHDLSLHYVRAVVRAMRAAKIDPHADRLARGDGLPQGGLRARDKPGQDDGGADPGAV